MYRRRLWRDSFKNTWDSDVSPFIAYVNGLIGWLYTIWKITIAERTDREWRVALAMLLRQQETWNRALYAYQKTDKVIRPPSLIQPIVRELAPDIDLENAPRSYARFSSVRVAASLSRDITRDELVPYCRVIIPCGNLYPELNFPSSSKTTESMIHDGFASNVSI